MTVQTFSQLLSKLESHYPETKVKQNFEEKNFEAIIPILIDTIIHSEVEGDRLLAVKTLQFIDDPTPVAKLKHTLLHDHHKTVRIAIIQMIGKLKLASMIPILTKIVNRDDDDEVIKTASLAIQVIQEITPFSSMDF
ncbi:MAG: HEAT repeat domain-containing protein [Candidatus Heimdallarchaeota archaeon]|nr:HEAT repeat domain-containing protein [Candidatus Heimdallarchaeota archaeon]